MINLNGNNSNPGGGDSNQNKDVYADLIDSRFQKDEKTGKS